MHTFFSFILFLSCANVLSRFNPDDVRSQTPEDCSDTGDCDVIQDSGTVNNDPDNESSTDPSTEFSGFSGYINQTFVFGQEYQNQGYTNCSIEMSLEPAGIYTGGGCSGCDLLGESLATLVTSCSFAENASGTFRMGIDTNNEIAYSYSESDGWQPLYDSTSCNGGLNISSDTSSLAVECMYDGDGYTQETTMNIRW